VREAVWIFNLEPWANYIEHNNLYPGLQSRRACEGSRLLGPTPLFSQSQFLILQFACGRRQSCPYLVSLIVDWVTETFRIREHLTDIVSLQIKMLFRARSMKLNAPHTGGPAVHGEHHHCQESDISKSFATSEYLHNHIKYRHSLVLQHSDHK
jgi:hypothetical protein